MLQFLAVLRGIAGISIASCVVLVALSAQAGPHVEVRGASRLDLRASGPASHILVRGSLVDEMGAPIPLAKISVAAQTTPPEPLPSITIHSCGEPAAPISGLVEVDATGAWCVLAVLPQDRATFRAVFGGDSLHEGTRAEIVWDASQQAVSLSFAPRPERVDLDAPLQKIGARVSVPADVLPSGIALKLRDERGTHLSAAQTDDAGSAVFDLPTERLQGPGIGALQIEFPGNGSLAATSVSTTVTRFARVRLAPTQRLFDGDPSSGVHLGVRGKTLRGPAEFGAVEAWLDSELVGAAPIKNGLADVIATFAALREGVNVDLTLRYVPSSPSLLPSESAVATIRPSQGPAWLRYIPVALAVLVASWLVRGWYRPRRMERRISRPRQPTGAQSLDIVGPSTSHGHWSGRVVDAQDGVGISGARIRVVAPSFVDLDIVVKTHSGSDGRFGFVVESSAPDLRLIVDAPTHSELDRLLPAPAEMMICLVSRRRMLLQRLVEWARRAGRPWDQAPEPTPGHVVSVGRAHPRRDDISTWAETVERSAYGPEPVDSRVEHEVLALEPGRQPLR